MYSLDIFIIENMLAINSLLFGQKKDNPEVDDQRRIMATLASYEEVKRTREIVYRLPQSGQWTLNFKFNEGNITITKKLVQE